MMITTMDPAGAFLWSFVLGLIVSAAYFVYALLLSVLKPSRICVCISDFMFGNLVLLFNFFYSVALTEGKLRGYTIAAEMLVFFLSYCLLLRPVKRLLARIINEIEKRTQKQVQKTMKACRTLISVPRYKKKTKSEKKI